MGEINNNIIENDSKIYSRNTPLALVVGAAGFLGSHLTEALLNHNIQVIGVDNLSTGTKENLNVAVKNNKFHLIHLDATKLNLNLPRLDYVIFTAEGLGSIGNILDLAKDFKSKIVLISSISLYDKKEVYRLGWLSDLEIQISKFAKEHNLNARVVRLSAVFGPRMHFREKDPIVRLIQASLLDELQNESLALEFSSRAIFIDDAVGLIIKSILAGSTARRIFDGAAIQPIQVSEIKQVLLDPIWYEQKGFHPSELPPWPTPNLKQTMAHLNWSAKSGLVEGLKKTISYFKESKVEIPSLKGFGREFDRGWWEEEKEKRLKQNVVQISNTEQRETSAKFKLPNFSFNKNQFFLSLGWVLIFYALVFPILTLIVGAVSFRHNLDLAANDLNAGEYDRSLQDVKQAAVGINLAKDWLLGLTVFRKTGILQKEMGELDEVLVDSLELTSSLNHLIIATKSLNQGFSVTTDSKTSFRNLFAQGALEFQLASTGFSKVRLALDSTSFQGLPTLQKRVEDLKSKIVYFENLSKNGQNASIILENALDGKKTYLLVLQNNLSLRPGGGKIISLAQIDFEEGKLKKVAVQDVNELDSLIKVKQEPPKEIKEDSGKDALLLSDSNWEPDFPTNASQANLFFKQITGKGVDGVITVDVDGFSKLLSSMGPVEIEGFGQIDSDNLLGKVSSSDSKFLISLQRELLNRIFFGSKGILPKTGEDLISLFKSKHLMVVFFDPKLEALSKQSNFSGSLDGSSGNDFLAEVESNIGGNFVNKDISRKFILKVGLDDKGVTTDKLSISLVNSSLKEDYKSRVRIYVPTGTKLNRIIFGEADYKNKLSTFSDYGKTGYLFVITLEKGEQKTLILEYQIPIKFENSYKVDIIKQAGTGNDKFGLEFNSGKEVKKISSDLSEDRHFAF